MTHMREDPNQVLSRTGISCDVFNRNVSAPLLENAINLLVRSGQLVVGVVKTKGRPATVYKVAT